MKPPPCPAADSPDLGGPHVDLVLDPDKLRIDVYLVRGKSVSVSQASADLAPAGPANLLLFDGEHHSGLLNEHFIEVRRRWYNPNKWLPVLASLMLYSTPWSLTTFAALLAGRKHGASRNEWLAHLAGDPGYQFGRWGQLRAALGFVAAAARFRAEDAADLAMRPADAILASRLLSGLLTWGLVGVMILFIVRHDGRWGLVADIADPIALGGILSLLLKKARERRGIKLPEPKPRRPRG
jgi:hypothetical protein